MAERRPPRRPWRWRIVIVAIALAAAAGGASAGESEREGSAAAVTVRMTDQLTFEPAEVEIPVGARVTWKSDSVLVHTATADPTRAADPDRVAVPEGGEPFDSGSIPPGGSWSRRFEVPGLWRYVCVPHEASGMRGTVRVVPDDPGS